PRRRAPAGRRREDARRLGGAGRGDDPRGDIRAAQHPGRPPGRLPDPEAADRRPMTARIPMPRLARVRSGRVGLVLLAFVLLVALIGPLVAPHDPAQPIGLPGLPPSADAPLGTDGLGRDVLSRVLHGGLTVIGLGIAAAAVSYLGGLTIGLLAGYSRNLLDAGLMRGVDVLLAFPPLLFVLVLVTGAGTSALVLVLAVGIVQITGISRIV